MLIWMLLKANNLATSPVHTFSEEFGLNDEVANCTIGFMRISVYR